MRQPAFPPLTVTEQRLLLVRSTQERPRTLTNVDLKMSRCRRPLLLDGLTTMRAFYATYKDIRVFVFGVPEGWHVGIYDLQRKQWQMDSALHNTLREAKAAAENKRQD